MARTTLDGRWTLCSTAAIDHGIHGEELQKRRQLSKTTPFIHSHLKRIRSKGDCHWRIRGAADAARERRRGTNQNTGRKHTFGRVPYSLAPAEGWIRVSSDDIGLGTTPDRPSGIESRATTSLEHDQGCLEAPAPQPRRHRWVATVMWFPGNQILVRVCGQNLRAAKACAATSRGRRFVLKTSDELRVNRLRHRLPFTRHSRM